MLCLINGFSHHDVGLDIMQRIKSIATQNIRRSQSMHEEAWHHTLHQMGHAFAPLSSDYAMLVTVGQ